MWKFGSKPSVSNLIETLIRKASVDAVLENGNYMAFLVQLDADIEPFKAHLKNPEVQSAIVSLVEGRIASRQFEDPCDGIAMLSEVREASGWKPNLNVPRMVVGLQGKPLCKWAPPPPGAEEYELQTFL